MSLLFPKKIIIGLGADYVSLAEVKGDRLETWHMERFEHNKKDSWHSGLSIVLKRLSALSLGNIHVSFRLSSDLAPISLLPWRNEITKAEQQALLAEAHFIKIYGNDAAEWKIAVDTPNYGQSWIASGVNLDMIENITLELQRIGAKVTSISPLTISVFNEVKASIKASHAWLLIPEVKNLIALYLIEGEWKLLQTIPLSNLESESISEILTREAKLSGLQEHHFQIYHLGNQSLNINAIKLDVRWRANPGIPAQQPTYLIGGLK